ncbi:MAG: glycosyltransferase family 2 protein [Actinomycetes bacterium]
MGADDVRRYLAEGRPSITIAIPAYNEGSGIVATLESLWAGMRALGITKSPIFLSDSSSDLGTVEAAESWAQQAGCKLVVDHSDNRRSLKAALNVILRFSRSDILIVTVADVVVPEESLTVLLATLLTSPYPDVVVGVGKAHPLTKGLRRRAGAFQIRAVERVVELSPPAMRAEGAFWGAWRRFYGTYRFPEGGEHR